MKTLMFKYGKGSIKTRTPPDGSLRPVECSPRITPRLWICEEVDHLTIKGRTRLGYLGHPEKRQFFQKVAFPWILHLDRELTPGGGAAKKSFGPVDNDINTISEDFYKCTRDIF